MKRNSKRITPLRVKLLPGCLALALGMGAGLFAPAHASTDIRSPERAQFDAQRAAASLPAYAGDVLISQLLGMQRMPPPVPANSILVSNCNNTGAGSLRAAVGAAVDGDTINMTALACSTITLTTGAITIAQASLTLAGPGVSNLEISGNDTSRVFFHVGAGTLAIKDLSISHGKKYLKASDTVGNAGGGCVVSSGNITMVSTWTNHCDAGTNKPNAVVRGGAIYAKVGAVLSNSIVSHSTAHSNVSEVRGGGLYTPGELILSKCLVTRNEVSYFTASSGGGVQVGSPRPGGSTTGTASIKYSTLAENNARGGFGGGAYLTGDATVSRSTISGNSGCRGGGLYFVGGGAVTGPSVLQNSTVSGNKGDCTTGAAGLAIFGKDATIRDSTIAFNKSGSGVLNTYGAGVRISTVNTVNLQNTIIANNTTTVLGQGQSAGQVDDIDGVSGATLAGANNLIYAPALTAPGGTILSTDPMLRALADNGGDTDTHMPNFGSPVINAGNNASGATTDQRGAGFPRIRGAQADIGAVEFNLADFIFKNGFD